MFTPTAAAKSRWSQTVVGEENRAFIGKSFSREFVQSGSGMCEISSQKCRKKTQTDWLGHLWTFSIEIIRWHYQLDIQNIVSNYHRSCREMSENPQLSLNFLPYWYCVTSVWFPTAWLTMSSENKRGNSTSEISTSSTKTVFFSNGC